MSNTIHPFTVENRLHHLRLIHSQMGEILSQAENLLKKPHPEFDPKKLYRCRNSVFHATIHYTRDRHYGCIWQNGSPPVSVSWDLAGKYAGFRGKHESWNLVNYDNDANPSPDPREAAIAKDHRKQLDLRMTIDLGNHMAKQVGDRLLVEAWANVIKSVRHKKYRDLDSSCGE